MRGVVRRLGAGDLPSPLELAAWASREYDEVVLWESYQGGAPRVSLVAFGSLKKLVSHDPLSSFNKLEELLNGFGGFALGYVAFECVGSYEPRLRGLARHEMPSLLVFQPAHVVRYDFNKGLCEVRGDPLSLNPRRAGPPEFSVRGVVYKTSRGSFLEWVREALRLLRRGEAYQLVLSRLERYEHSGSLLDVYRRLTRINPSPYSYYLRVGGYELAGCSPEALVKSEGGLVETHPIAGTRPRGRSEEEDAELSQSLASDPKELAEHIMLVDLARNDLARVSVPGSVVVPELLRLERYSHVQHLVSRVVGRLRPGVSFTDVMRAVFPAGTVTGAPKIRAIRVISELEDSPRGPYSGAVGLMGARDGDTAIVIRSAWAWGGKVEVRAGAGVVMDSSPEREFRETEFKLAAVKQALGV